MRVGKCWLEPGEDRAPRALPTAQRYRIAQMLSHMRLRQPGLPERAFTHKERGVLAALLYQGKDRTLDQVRRLLGLSPETDFNTRDDKLVGCATASSLGNGGKAAIGPKWHALDLATQDAAVMAILAAETDEQAAEALAGLGIAASAGHAAKIVLPDGHAAFSARALGKILPKLESGLRYDEAVQAAGYAHHSDRRTGEVRDCLPYYGELLFERIGTGTGEPDDPDEKRLGRAPNPTVHVALNEVRRVVNAIVDRYGPPAEVVVETLRELGRSARQRQEYEKIQKRNRTANDDRRKELAHLDLRDNSANRMRLRLWQEQAADPKNRVCPYSGTLITARMALTDAIEEDHILPFAITLDDGAANRILVTRESNRAKARRTPFEAFGHGPDWPDILERIKLLPEQKRWRFAPDALEKFVGSEDFLARHLTDSATIALWARDYLNVLAPGKVWTIPGKLTSLLRHELGLTSKAVLGKGGARKERDDHRHHAIDAVVVALTDRGLLQRMTVAANGLIRPGSGCCRIFPRHGTAFWRTSQRGRDPWWCRTSRTSVGRTRCTTTRRMGRSKARRRVGRTSWCGARWKPWRPGQPMRFWASVRDLMLGSKVAAAVSEGDAASRKAALAAIKHSGGHTVRRVRTVERLEATVAIADRRTGKPYKLVKRDGNHRAELWRLPDGKLSLCVISTFDAARQAEASRLKRPMADLRPHPAAKLLMRLHKDDMVAFGVGPERRLLRIVKMRDGQVTLAPPNEAGNLKARDEAKDDAFKYIYAGAARLDAERARKIMVTPDGRVLDHGPMP